jgi:hypothetical protein
MLITLRKFSDIFMMPNFEIFQENNLFSRPFQAYAKMTSYGPKDIDRLDERGKIHKIYASGPRGLLTWRGVFE